MKASDFKNLLKGIREAGAYLRGNKKTAAKKTNSQPLRENTSVEVGHISPHGLRLLIGEREYLLPFTDYPWFAGANVSAIRDVKLLHGHHLHWPSLDIDLDLASLNDPAGYPLLSKSRTV
jgi:hypothetical protein